MICCSCCERRWPASANEYVGSCSCVTDYCPMCLRCEQHCRCTSLEPRQGLASKEETCDPPVIVDV
jgi:hypothetical protein